jgi:hypothetical protein
MPARRIQHNTTQHIRQRGHAQAGHRRGGISHACENTRRNSTNTIRKRRRHVKKGAKPAHECCKAKTTATHAHTTSQRRCAVQFAAKEQANCWYRKHHHTHKHVAEHTQPRERAPAHA